MLFLDSLCVSSQRVTGKEFNNANSLRLNFNQLLFQPRRSLFGGQQLLAQALSGFAIDSCLVCKGFKRKQFLTKLIDLEGPAVLVCTFALLGALCPALHFG